jgi:hypothetical protein
MRTRLLRPEFWADSRMPASLVGLAATPLGTAPLPLDAIARSFA